jgi:hypothetical protein
MNTQNSFNKYDVVITTKDIIYSNGNVIPRGTKGVVKIVRKPAVRSMDAMASYDIHFTGFNNYVTVNANQIMSFRVLD